MNIGIIIEIVKKRRIFFSKKKRIHNTATFKVPKFFRKILYLFSCNFHAKSFHNVKFVLRKEHGHL